LCYATFCSSTLNPDHMRWEVLPKFDKVARSSSCSSARHIVLRRRESQNVIGRKCASLIRQPMGGQVSLHASYSSTLKGCKQNLKREDSSTYQLQILQMKRWKSSRQSFFYIRFWLSCLIFGEGIELGRQIGHSLRLHSHRHPAQDRDIKKECDTQRKNEKRKEWIHAVITGWGQAIKK